MGVQLKLLGLFALAFFAHPVFANAPQTGMTQKSVLETTIAGQAKSAIATDNARPMPTSAALVTGTPVFVGLVDGLSTETSSVGDQFQIIVLQDVISDHTTIIPQGTLGYGEVTFVTKKGGFGKPGILGFSVRHLDLNGKKILLDGRYRQEGTNRSGTTALTFFAAGIFAGLVKGDTSSLPKGQQLKARTGEEITYTPGRSALAVLPQPVIASRTEPTTTSPNSVGDANPSRQDPTPDGAISKTGENK